MLAPLHTLWSAEPRAYTGPELRPHFLYETFGLRGSALVAFQGSCHVQTEHLVDWEDRIARDHIRAERMLHVLGEFFGVPLHEAIVFQRLWVACAHEVLQRLGVPHLSRTGDDLWITEPGASPLKLSVSIVTASSVSTLLHLGLNLDATGAPVAAVGLERYGCTSAETLASALLKAFAREWDGVNQAAVKVRGVT